MTIGIGKMVAAVESQRGRKTEEGKEEAGDV